jgi:hypothetical protein
MLLVGESFGDCSDEICGAVVQMRPKGLKLAIWTGEAKHEDAVRFIGKVFKDQLKLDDGTRIKYEVLFCFALFNFFLPTDSNGGYASKSRYEIPITNQCTI